MIDAVNDDTFELYGQKAKDISAGGFNWDLIFMWHFVPEAERKRRNYQDYLPFRYPLVLF